MDQPEQYPSRMQGARGNLPIGFRELLHELLAHTNRDYSQMEVVRHICSSLLRFSGCDMLSFRLDENGKTGRYRAVVNEDGSGTIEIHCTHPTESDPVPGEATADPIEEPILQAIVTGSFAAPTQSFTRGRSFWIGDTARPILLSKVAGDDAFGRTAVIGGAYTSLAVILVPVSDRIRGFLFLASRRRDFFTKDDIQAYEAVAETIGVVLAHHSTQWALRERVKELSCLYGIDKVAARPGILLDEFLQDIVELLPPGWQYPEITSARIILDGRRYVTAGFNESPYRQSAEIVVGGVSRGSVDIFYARETPLIDEGPFLKEERNLINAAAETIGRQVALQESQWDRRERVKELTCLYGIAKAASRSGVGIDDFLREIVDLLPPAWQFPEIAQACITLDGRSFATQGYQECPERQGADIAIDGIVRGNVEVVYTEKKPVSDEGPFLKEERNLINEVARQIGLIVLHWETEQETARLQEQLRHADRLATVGQLSAGVAHELNEPLVAILGFAQLLKGSAELSTQAVRDADKIINASLHAREIIRKLMLFTRQMPAKKAKCDCNQLVSEGLYFLESRCAKEGITIIRELEDGLPQFLADQSQLYQVLVNLAVNAVQAMPHGGTLTIRTRSDADNVYLSVEDTGIGMTPEVQKQLFIPFFTTKDVGQGTGLGLAVVHGIVAAHGGSITVQSEVGKGSAFDVRLPLNGPVNAKE